MTTGEAGHERTTGASSIHRYGRARRRSADTGVTPSAHPEECAASGLFSGTPSADVVRGLDGRRSDGCMNARPPSAGFDDSGAQLAAGESDGTDEPHAALEHAEAGAVRGRGRLQLRPRVRERLRVRRQLRRRPDLGRARRPDAGARVRRSTARARRTTSRSTTASSSRRPTRAARTTRARARRRPRQSDPDHVGGPEDLRRAQPVPAEVPGLGAHRLRLAHAHGAARARSR